MRNNIEILDTIDNKYTILKKIGNGSYGYIHKIKDESTLDFKAIKINKLEEKYYESIKNEKGILEELNQFTNINNELIPILYETTIYKKHICFILKLYDLNLYSYQKKYYNNNNNYNLNFIYSLTKNILTALNFIHSKNIIHCDLKPENILFKINSNDIIICDFGLSIKLTSEYKSYENEIQSSWYRSPEVVLKYDFNKKIDIWSFGTILYEIIFYKPLIKACKDYDIIGKIFTFLGPPDNKLIESYDKFKNYFNIYDHKENYGFKNDEEIKYYPFSYKIDKKEINKKFIKDDNDFNKFKLLWNCIRESLQWDEKLRLTSQELLNTLN